MILLQKLSWTKIIITALIVIALCVTGVTRLMERNEQLRLLREQQTVTETEKSERPPTHTAPAPSQSPSVQATQSPSVTKPPSKKPEETPDMPEVTDMPGNQDLDDYGNWLPPYETPEPEPAVVFRNETIIIPIE